MRSERLSIRIPAAMRKEFRRRASSSGRSESDVIREALAEYLKNGKRPRSAYAMAMELGLIGCYKGGPADLATNPKYRKGFGRGR